MRTLFPGSFDPVTNGHLDLIGRIAAFSDTVVVAVAINLDKRPMFTDEARVAMLQEACRQWPNVSVQTFGGLVVDAARQVEAELLVRGIRHSNELDREVQMALMNRELTGIETLLLPASPQWEFVSSSLVKEVARFGGDISAFVPLAVAERLIAHYRTAR